MVGITVSFMVKVTVTVQVSVNDRIWGRVWSKVWCDVVWKLGNSADNLCQPRSVAYSAELVLLNMHKISGGGACLHCYRKLVSPAIKFLLWPTVQWFCFGTFACFAWMCKVTIVDCIMHAVNLIYVYCCLLCELSQLHGCLLSSPSVVDVYNDCRKYFTDRRKIKCRKPEDAAHLSRGLH